MGNMMLCMTNSNVGIRIYDVEMKMVHVVIHVEEKQQYPNDNTNLQCRNIHDQHLTTLAC